MHAFDFFTALFTIMWLNTVENLNNFQDVDSKTASDKEQKHSKDTFLQISVPADGTRKISFSIFLKQK